MDDSDIWGYLVLLVIVWAIWEFASIPFSDTITLYAQSRECDQESGNNSKCKWKNMDRLSYKVIPSEQIVITLNTDSGDLLSKFTKCKVFDKENWVCNDHIFNYGFRDGEWILHDKENQRNILKIYWWLYHFLED